MAEPPSIDPLTLMHALVSAWNRGQAQSAPPPAVAVPVMPQGVDGNELAARLARIEAALLRIEAQLSPACEPTDKGGKRTRGKHRKGERG